PTVTASTYICTLLCFSPVPATTEIYSLSLHDALPIFFHETHRGRLTRHGGVAQENEPEVQGLTAVLVLDSSLSTVDTGEQDQRQVPVVDVRRVRARGCPLHVLVHKGVVLLHDGLCLGGEEGCLRLRLGVLGRLLDD